MILCQSVYPLKGQKLTQVGIAGKATSKFLGLFVLLLTLLEARFAFQQAKPHMLRHLGSTRRFILDNTLAVLPQGRRVPTG
jgi:hypothetical protein